MVLSSFLVPPQGYLQRCRQHTNLFPGERTDKLFANVEGLLMFQKAFLQDLESQISQGESWNAQIGQCFLRHVSAPYPHHWLGCSSLPTASITPIGPSNLSPHPLQSEDFAHYYSEYCNNHPFANGELADLNDDPRYSFFFEVS